MTENPATELIRPIAPLTEDEERRIRILINELAKGIEFLPDLLKRLGFTQQDYEELAQTRTFKLMLEQASAEWAGAANTHKRVRLKAAVNIEEALPSLYNGMVSMTEPLSSRVKAFEIMARIGGLGNPDPVQGQAGSSFQLTIHLDGDKAPMVIEGGLAPYSQSNLLEGRPDDWDEFT
jgi:hypothetical protein